MSERASRRAQSRPQPPAGLVISTYITSSLPCAETRAGLTGARSYPISGAQSPTFAASDGALVAVEVKAASGGRRPAKGAARRRRSGPSARFRRQPASGEPRRPADEPNWLAWARWGRPGKERARAASLTCDQGARWQLLDWKRPRPMLREDFDEQERAS